MILALAFAVGASLSPQERTIVPLGEPAVWAQIDAARLKGRPARLAWSDDRSELYLQMVDGTTAADLKFRHYIVRKGAAPTAIDRVPTWVDEYWKWKSAKSFFGDAQLTIAVDTERRILDNLNGTGATRTAYLSDVPLTGNQLTLARQPGETHMITRLMLKGTIVGEFVDELIVPGYTFSWSPETLRLIAFRSQNGHLTIMDDDGRTQPVHGAGDVLLPAWSDDGAAIAYLERTGRRTFTVSVVEIQQR